jgi:hypothetical protein
VTEARCAGSMAVVTGAGSCIGRAVALRLAREAPVLSGTTLLGRSQPFWRPDSLWRPNGTDTSARS